MQLIPKYRADYEPPTCTIEENLTFLKKGFASLSDLLSNKCDTSSIEVDVWNSDGVTIAVAPRIGDISAPIFFYHTDFSALLLCEIGMGLKHIKLKHIRSGQQYILYTKPQELFNRTYP